jgi:dTDP-glucose 4,6-dehydratase
MDKVLILGSNSFAGAIFVDECLSEGFHVLGVSRSAEKSALFNSYRINPNIANFRFRQLHLVNETQELIKLVSEFNPNYVVDFAGQGMVAESWAAPELWFSTNLVSKVVLHNSLRQLSSLRKYIRVSTPEVYGSCPDTLSENFNYNPSTPYAVSHAAVDMSLMTFHRTFEFPVVLTRFSNFYGPGQQLYRIVPRTALSALTGSQMSLQGGGLSERSFIHGRDVADGLIRVLRMGSTGQIYHFSTDEFIKIRDLVFLVCRKLAVDPSSFVAISEERLGKDFSYRISAEKARYELGWTPRFSLASGIDDTMGWIKTNLSALKRLPRDYVHQV